MEEQKQTGTCISLSNHLEFLPALLQHLGRVGIQET